jgi:hypothetical protein
MEQFRENCERREAAQMPEDPDVPPLEWARQQVSLATSAVTRTVDPVLS